MKRGAALCWSKERGVRCRVERLFAWFNGNQALACRHVYWCNFECVYYRVYCAD